MNSVNDNGVSRFRLGLAQQRARLQGLIPDP